MELKLKVSQLEVYSYNTKFIRVYAVDEKLNNSIRFIVPEKEYDKYRPGTPLTIKVEV
jgi:hypothetical protein